MTEKKKKPVESQTKNMNAWIGADEHAFLKELARKEQMTVTMVLRLLIRQERDRREAAQLRKDRGLL